MLKTAAATAALILLANGPSLAQENGAVGAAQQGAKPFVNNENGPLANSNIPAAGTASDSAGANSVPYDHEAPQTPAPRKTQ